MTPTEIKIAIAESLGWKPEETDEWVESLGGRDGHYRLTKRKDYYHSLDACAEFESTLTDDERDGYAHTLSCVVLGRSPEGWWDLTADEAFKLATATAAQRCVAYLKMKGLWK